MSIPERLVANDRYGRYALPRSLLDRVDSIGTEAERDVADATFECLDRACAQRDPGASPRWRDSTRSGTILDGELRKMSLAE